MQSQAFILHFKETLDAHFRCDIKVQTTLALNLCLPYLFRIQPPDGGTLVLKLTFPTSNNNFCSQICKL